MAGLSLRELERDQLLMWIEAAIEDFVRQLAQPKTKERLCLRTSEDESKHHLFYTKRTAAKLAYNMKTLSQVYTLLLENKHSTLRDLYYDEKHLYRRQDVLNRSMTAICELLDVAREQVNVISCSKGLLGGSLCFISNSSSTAPIDCSASIVLITEQLLTLQPLSSATYILVVEKDATFQKLIDDGFFTLYPNSILCTGKGYPDLCTRRVLNWLSTRLNIPVFGLFDADPHGLEIFLTYKYGSSKERSEGRGATVPSIQWLGLRPSDELSLPIADDQMLQLKHADFTKAVRVRRRAEGLRESEVVREIDYLRSRRAKMELEAVSSAGAGFLPRLYLAPRLRYLLTNSA